MISKYILIFFVFLFFSCGEDSVKTNENTEVRPTKWNGSILTSANSWVYKNPSETDKIISETGIESWTNPDTKIRTYFRVENTGKIHIGINAKTNGNATIKLTFKKETKVFKISNSEFENMYVGTFNIHTPGYYFVELQGFQKTNDTFANVKEVLISGKATEGKNYFVKEDIYWGRRGPSVHLNYNVPEASSDIVWFYNEMTIPKDQDIIGSYFMANGFGEGYFGIQVNSATERRILFSVWSPYKTDDPQSIPEDQKIILLKKGKDVVAGEFGNEGSGGQSRRVFNWKAGNTYKFLLKAIPSKNNSTDYSAYFFAPEIGKWELIASFRRPHTSTYLTRPHSFLENFIPNMGDVNRQVVYNNQWVYDTNGTWHALTKAKFTADATARKESRLDYAGGIENGDFFLKNCGFFNDMTIIDAGFEKKVIGLTPKINFDALPK